MFDLGWPELFIIVVVTLLVVGPKDLPGVLRTVTGTLRKARGMARELQRGIEDIAKETGVHDLKRDLERSTDFTKDLADLNADVDDALGPPKEGGNSIMSPAASKKLAADKVRAAAKAKTAAKEENADETAAAKPAPKKPAEAPTESPAEPSADTAAAAAAKSTT